MGFGRPTLYKETHPELLISIFKDKGDIADFCCKLMITRTTFYEWIDVHPEFAEAYKVAKEFTNQWLTHAGIYGMSMGKDFNATVWSMLMRNRCDFTEHRKIPIDLTQCKTSDEEMKMVKRKMAKGELTASEAKAMADIVSIGAQVHEKTEVEQRLAAIEQQVTK